MLVLAVSPLGINSAPAITFDDGHNLPDLHDCVIALLSRGRSKSTFWTTELFEQSTLFGGRSTTFPANDQQVRMTSRDQIVTKALELLSGAPHGIRYSEFVRLVRCQQRRRSRQKGCE